MHPMSSAQNSPKAPKDTHVPKRDFAYAETVRGHERLSLDAEACVCCKKYYETTGQDRLKSTSRHRSTFMRPSSPDDFWDIGPF